MTSGAHVVFGTGPAGRAAPFIVDDSAFRDAFGGYTTNWGDIVASTVDWYRAHTTTPDLANRLAEASTLKVT